MPPRWPREPDRNDPEYRRIDDRMNFAVHVGLFSAFNSGMWFVDILQKANWSWAGSVTGIWAILLGLHALYIFQLANYSPKSNG